MKEFFKQLITAGSGVSSKRMISLVALLLIAVITVGSLFGAVVSADLVWALVTLCLTAAGLTAIPYKNNSNTENNISQR